MEQHKDLSATERPERRRDAARTRAQLLDAAAELFGQMGYAATTLRMIGERAGADPALIARYFGNKEALYLESLTASTPPVHPGGPLAREVLQQMITRSQAAGVTPVARVAIAGTDDDEVRATVEQVIVERLVRPLRDGPAGVDGSDNDLRAELAVSIALGVSMACSSGVFANLATRPPDQIVELCAAAVDAVLGLSTQGLGTQGIGAEGLGTEGLGAEGESAGAVDHSDPEHNPR